MRVSLTLATAVGFSRRAIAPILALFLLCSGGRGEAADQAPARELIDRVRDAQLTDQLLEPEMAEPNRLKALLGAHSAKSRGDGAYRRIELTKFKASPGTRAPPPVSAVFERWGGPAGSSAIRLSLQYLRGYPRNLYLRRQDERDGLVGYTYRVLDDSVIYDAPFAVQFSRGYFCPSPGTDRRVEVGSEAFFALPVRLVFISRQDATFDGSTPDPLGAVAIAVSGGWTAVMSEEERRGLFPERAFRLEKTGRAQLTCQAGQEGRLTDCKLVHEAPADYGFGNAALKWSRAASLDRPAGMSVPAKDVTVDMTFVRERDVGPCPALARH